MQLLKKFFFCNFKSTIRITLKHEKTTNANRKESKQ